MNEERPRDYGKYRVREGEVKTYIGAKIIKAVPMEHDKFLQEKGQPYDVMEIGQPGYKVIYPDGYVSWSPKHTFETAYRLLTIEELAMI